MKKFLSDFKEFISKGNVVDMAVGVIIGNAFSNIVSSLVKDLMMPLIGIIIGGHDFSNLYFKINNVQINYGILLQNIVDFLIVAFCLFIVIKAMNKLRTKLEHKEKNEKKKEEIVKSNEEIILEEIRDLLKSSEKVTK